LGTAEHSPAETARQVREGLVRVSDDVHALSYRLHPLVLEDLGLVAALKTESERFTQRESIPVEVKLHDLPESTPRDAALCLFRVAQEALRNVARHAQAAKVEITLRGLEDGLQLAVRDDGRGFDPAAQRSPPSLGLSSMRERVHLLGGELDIESAPGQGTIVVGWVPFHKGPKAGG
jgi:signal transduction histidine kinase